MATIVRIGLIALLVNLSVAASAQKTVNYTVRKGESLYTIAHKHGLRLPELVAVNRHLRNPHALQPGEIIKIPVKGSAPRTSTKATPPKDSGWAIINKDRVNIRQGAGTNTKRISVVDRGTQVQILARQGEWKRVRLANGRVGWVLGSLLSPIAPPKTSPVATQPRESNLQASAQRQHLSVLRQFDDPAGQR